jgi:multidrug efflux pump subunit AcrA (membrane-fusion protein)
MKRKIIVSLAGIALIVFSVMGARYMSGLKKDTPRMNQSSAVPVIVDKINNTDIPIKIVASGQLEARNKLELFSEVQGIMEIGSRPFFEGTFFNRGEVMIRINSEEFESSLKAQKSNFYNLLASVMPDLRLDFPSSADNWNKYIRDFSVGKTLAELPDPSSDQEKFYLAGKNIFSTYYSIKNLEVRLAKHKIVAPFSGYVTDVMVRQGTLIRPGQKLGEFASQNVFELKVPVNAADEKFLRIGKKVIAHNVERTKSWTGTVIRINKKVDTRTQSILAVIELNDKDLRDGMFLEAELDAKIIPDVAEISRKLLTNDNKMFIVKDSMLSNIFVEPLHFSSEGTAIVKGIPDGSYILGSPVPGAYEGMKVRVINNK